MRYSLPFLLAAAICTSATACSSADLDSSSAGSAYTQSTFDAASMDLLSERLGVETIVYTTVDEIRPVIYHNGHHERLEMSDGPPWFVIDGEFVYLQALRPSSDPFVVSTVFSVDGDRLCTVNNAMIRRVESSDKGLIALAAVVAQEGEMIEDDGTSIIVDCATNATRQLATPPPSYEDIVSTNIEGHEIELTMRNRLEPNPTTEIRLIDDEGSVVDTVEFEGYLFAASE